MEPGIKLQDLNRPGYQERRDPIVAPNPVEGGKDVEGGEVGGTQPHVSHLILPLALNKHRKQRFWAPWLGDALKILLTFIAVILPWILFDICLPLGGIPLRNSIIQKYPQESAFFVTSIAVLSYLASFFLFQNAVTTFAKFWNPTPTRLDIDIFFIALKNPTHYPELWGFGKHLYLSVIILAIFFAFVTSGIAALLLPIKYHRSTTLTGTELDFASNNTDCINWFDNNGISSECGWQRFKGLIYNDCLNNNRMLDAIQAGHSNALSTLVNHTSNATYAYRRLSEVGGLYFLGSTRGVLPNGPNGISVFNTLSNSSFSSWMSVASSLSGLSHNYTLELQGVSNNVTCAYTSYANVTFIGIYDWTVSGICQQPTETFLNPPAYAVSPSNHTLGFWACRRSPTGQSYNMSYDLFLRGTNHYESNIGNVTCTISSTQVVVSLTYSSHLGAFTTQRHSSTSLKNNTKLMDTAVQGVGDVLWKAQSRETNLVGDMMVGLAGGFLKLPTHAEDTRYLRLFEAVIQGILDHQVTSIRFIYSARSDKPAPAFCMRTFNGSASFDEFGWHVTGKTAAFLVPMTLINMISLAMLVVAFHKTYIDNTDERDVTFLGHVDLFRSWQAAL